MGLSLQRKAWMVYLCCVAEVEVYQGQCWNFPGDRGEERSAL